MQNAYTSHAGRSRPRPAARPCQPSADFANSSCQHFPDFELKECSSQLGSSVSTHSDIQMTSPAQADFQLESVLQCEEQHFLTSPPNSNTSSASYHDPDTYASPLTASRLPTTSTQLPCHRIEVTGPSLEEVPTEAIWETDCIASHARPGYVDPGPASAIFQIATTYGFTSLMISVGTSYFRRLAASNYAMLQAGLTSPQFYSFMLPMEVYPLEKSSKPLVGVIHAKYLPTNEAWLTLIHLTCIYLAAKVLEYVPCKNMLQTMMGHIYGAEPCKVSTYLVSQLELECLSALDWRLGPVYQSNL